VKELHVVFPQRKPHLAILVVHSNCETALRAAEGLADAFLGTGRRGVPLQAWPALVWAGHDVQQSLEGLEVLPLHGGIERRLQPPRSLERWERSLKTLPSAWKTGLWAMWMVTNCKSLSESDRLLEIAGESGHPSLLTPHFGKKLFCVNRQHRRHGGAIGKDQRCDDRTTLSGVVDIHKIEGRRANQGS
jgi:hypothetical protein